MTGFGTVTGWIQVGIPLLLLVLIGPGCTVPDEEVTGREEGGANRSPSDRFEAYREARAGQDHERVFQMYTEDLGRKIIIRLIRDIIEGAEDDADLRELAAVLEQFSIHLSHLSSGEAFERDLNTSIQEFERKGRLYAELMKLWNGQEMDDEGEEGSRTFYTLSREELSRASLRNLHVKGDEAAALVVVEAEPDWFVPVVRIRLIREGGRWLIADS